MTPIEQRIRAAIDAAKSAGIRLTSGRWMNLTGPIFEACAMGCVVAPLDHDTRFEYDLVGLAASELGVTTNWAERFIDGFDGYPRGAGEAYKLGRKLRKEYIDV